MIMSNRPEKAEAATDRETRMPDFRRRPVILTAITLLALFAGSYPARTQTLRAVKERGTLNCGVSQGLLGFSSMDDKNAWTGFDVDIDGGDFWRCHESDVYPARCGRPICRAAV